MAEALKPSASMSTSNDEGKTYRFKIGEEFFSLNEEQVKKIPFFEALANDHFLESKDDAIVVKGSSADDLELIKIAVTYVQRNRSKVLLTKLPEQYTASKIFAVLDFLLIPKPTLTIKDLDQRMKATTTLRDKLGICKYENRSGARDASVELCWLVSGMELDFKQEQQLYNLVLFVVSHPRTFYPLRLRTHILKWYMENFRITPKQSTTFQSVMEKFVNHDPSVRWDEDDDKTSSGGSVDFEYDSYDSD